jgi:maleylpyruvate isomerase
VAVTAIAPVDLQTTIADGQNRLRGLLAGLTEEAVRAPSALPGWSRGHLLTHLEGAGLALARQARYALRGKLIDVYDGGRPARDAAIDAGRGRSAQRLTAALGNALDEVEASWSAVGPDDWHRPVRYRDGVLLDAGLGWWRELEIHTADALLGFRTTDWSQPFCVYAVDYLVPRVPDGIDLTLTATDGPWTWTRGSGTPVAVQGRLTDLAAWLAGRIPAAPLTGDPVPPLGNWP